MTRGLHTRLALLLLLLGACTALQQHQVAAAAASLNGNPSHEHPTPSPIPEVNDSKGTKKEVAEIQKSGLLLTKLIVINRHGHRAPNAPYWDMCPNDKKNQYRYKVDAEDLTARGMKEEYGFGRYMRHKYRDFLGNRFNRTLHFFRAVGEPRILQSAMAVAQGIFPDGFGPGGYLPSRPQFVPVFSDMDTHEYLLDDVPCFRRAESDMYHWLNNSLSDFVADPNVAEVVKSVRAACGPAVGKSRPLYAYLKTVADGMTFNADYGLKVCGGNVTPEVLFKIRNVSLGLLMARLYHTDVQQTYTAVDLPYRFLRLMEPRSAHKKNNSKDNSSTNNTTSSDDEEDKRRDAVLYFVHREALYAFAQFFGFQYNVPGLPSGELPVASALIMEKLQPASALAGGKNKTSYVKFVLWTPYDGTSTVEVPRCKIPQLCRVDELRQLHDDRVARTGTWDKLCNYTFSEMDHNTDIR
ncbi:acid phosphatase [Trypanosoma grayi]|uniref:acid phosphatase n=1 Tax=Trypanosoma grayi TaxID=71804 RepID=UPI0004F4ACF7|nr:acid phosphatase [Trypanosoma grayi]KEG08404.1 acid phosphatase [Trypanosoma grayi]